jgi:tRNA threonylcarbamoyladenosine biosynthesis protein TsaB
VTAVAAKVEGSVVAAVDAGRGEVYIGQYLVEREGACVRSEQLLRNSDFPAAVGGLVVSTPDTAVAQIARDAALTVHLVTVGPESIAEVGWRKLRAGQTVSPVQLEANYIRRSDAEIFSKPASSS